MASTIKIGGIEYKTHSALDFGDYGGFEAVGLANIRYIIGEHKDSVYQVSDQTLQHASENAPYGLGKEALEDIQRDKPEVLDTYGSYSYRQVWIRADLANEYLEQLDNYPCLDDGLVSQIEMEWEQEAWESWLKSDLLRTLPEELQDKAEELSDEVLWAAYQQAMEEMNEYPVTENSSVSVRVETIAEAFKFAVLEKIKV